jgi:hypothetical protein
LWHFEPNYQQKLEQVETKYHEVLQAWSNKGSYVLAEQEHAPFCNGGIIPLRSAFLQKLLQKCWIVLRLLTMFAPNFFPAWVVVGVWTKMIGRLEGTTIYM